MALPNRVLSATCEISTGQLSVAERPPVYTGENGALQVEVSFENDGESYDISGLTAEMYLFYPMQQAMTEAVQMSVSGSVASGALGEGLTAQPGYPLLVIQLTDAGSGALIVACAQPLQITETRGDVVITTRPPTPSEIVYVGRAPYINPVNNNWMVWDNDSGAYVDSGVGAVGTPNVGSVNGKTGVVTLYGTDISVSTSDSTKISTKLAGIEQDVSDNAQDISDLGDTVATKADIPGWYNMGTISSLPVTKLAEDVTTDMICTHSQLGTPSAQTSDWTVNTDTAGQITISGSISGSTTLYIKLEKVRTVTPT